MFSSAMEFFSQHILLANLAHVAGGFGLALVLQRYFRGKVFLSDKVGWLLLAFALIVHIFAYAS